MSTSSRLIAERTIGQFPLSIATSLAFESLVNIHPELKHKHVPITEYPRIWVNLRTLYRNLMGALESDARSMATDVDLANAIHQEMEVIENVVHDYSDRCEVKFYVSNYKGIEGKYPHAVIRRDNTELQKHFTALLELTLKRVLEMEGQPGHNVQDPRVSVFDLKLQPKQHGKTLILTHIPYDLCSEKAFGELVLLESHTGAIKERAQWYTKFLNGKELPMIPFREDMLQIFGDAETFRPGDPKLRRELIDVATKYRWTAVTTRDKIVYGIETIRNPFFKSVLRAMLV